MSTIRSAHRGPKDSIKSSRTGFQALILGLAVLIAFGGGTHPLTLGLLALVIGSAMLFCPPTHRIGGIAESSLVALFIYTLLMIWLPASHTEWRQAAKNLGIHIESSVSSQPWASIEALVSFAIGYALLGLALANKPDAIQRDSCTKLVANSLLVLGLGSILATNLDMRLPWADQVHVFSWFPNRNQSALIFASGSVLSFGLAFLPWHRRDTTLPSTEGNSTTFTATIWMSSIRRFFFGVLLLYAVFLSLSKGALIAWSGGMLALFILTAARTKIGGIRLLRVALALAILLFSFFVFFGGKSRERLIDFIATPLGGISEDAKIPRDFRWQIYSETASLIADQPWTGVGLGQFQYVFPQYRSIPAAPVAIRHPESDLLWWAAELGIIGLCLIAACIGSLLFRLYLPKDSRSKDLDAHGGSIDQLYRHAAIAALIPFFVHGLVDVGAHRIGTVALAIILYALALPPGAQSFLPQNLYRQLWRASGVTILLAGLVILALTSVQSPLLGAYAPTAKEPLRSRPLQWQPYFRTAVQTYSSNRQAALDSFEKARFLKADNSAIPLQEGLFLLHVNDRKPAFAAFESAILRSHNPIEPFRQILRRTSSDSRNHNKLRSLAQMNSELIAAYWAAIPLKGLSTEEAITGLNKDWKILSAAEQKPILQRLNRHKLPEAALALYKSSSFEKQRQTWPVAMQILVATENWEEGLSLLNRWITHKPLPDETISDRKLQKLQATALLHPNDPVAATRLLNAYISRRMWNDVRRAAQKTRMLPEYPPDTLYWLGLALANTGHKQASIRIYAEWLSQKSE